MAKRTKKTNVSETHEPQGLGKPAAKPRGGRKAEAHAMVAAKKVAHALAMAQRQQAEDADVELAKAARERMVPRYDPMTDMVSPDDGAPLTASIDIAKD
jgi:hypothetical protein